MDLEVADHESVGECFFLPDRLFAADVAIVFGMNDWQRPCRYAVDLYRRGLARKLLFTGGYNPKIAKVEAVQMATLARVLGVADEDIIIESRSVHTGQNILHSKQALDARLRSEAVRSVILVTIHYHLRRSLIAARRHFPSDVLLGWACYPSRYYSSADWYKTERGRADIAAEIEKIERYYSIGMKDLLRDQP